LINRFNSVDSWWDEMIQVGVLAHGWAVTVVSPKDHQDIQTVLLDPGESNFPPGYMPICAVDCHEHAYWMDHGFDKKRYLEAMKRFINWEALDERFSFATR
jgi:superoxide dismutase